MRWAEPPTDESDLLFRATSLAGRSLGELADVLQTPVPPNLKRNKGWIGTLLEAALGATASNRPVPDFEQLGIELKTLPLDEQGRVKETTFVTSAPLDGSIASTWEASRVREKLSAVLWIPIVGSGAPGERLIGQGVLWHMDEEEEARLKEDWEELTGLLALGQHWEVDARRGEALQLRPKAATSSSLTWTLGEDGDWVQTGPLGFYLRTSFTRKILEKRLRF